MNKPPNIDIADINQIKKYLINYGEHILKHECIKSKFQYLNYVESVFQKVENYSQKIIYRGLFSLCRDINPAIRERALNVLSEQAPIPLDWIPFTISKGEDISENDLDPELIKFLKNNKVFVGTIGMCLEDPYPKVKTAAILALVKSIIIEPKSSIASQVMNAITQLTNDTQFVRTTAVKGLYQISTIVGHFITLEDSQLRLVLPVIFDKDSPLSGRIDVLNFIGRLKVISTNQMSAVFDDLAKIDLDRCDWGVVLTTAYTFGRNNSSFARVALLKYFEKPCIWAYPYSRVLTQLLVIYGANDESPFPLPREIQAYGPRFIPLLMLLRRQYEKNKLAFQIDDKQLNKSMNNQLALEINKAAEEFIEAEDNQADQLSQVDHIVKPEPEIVKYKGDFTLPFRNSKYFPDTYQPNKNICIYVSGKVSPVPLDGTVLLMIRLPLDENPKLFPVELNKDGVFDIKPTLNIPLFTPFFKMELRLLLEIDNQRLSITEQPFELWLQPE